MYVEKSITKFTLYLLYCNCESRLADIYECNCFLSRWKKSLKPLTVISASFCGEDVVKKEMIATKTIKVYRPLNCPRALFLLMIPSPNIEEGKKTPAPHLTMSVTARAVGQLQEATASILTPAPAVPQHPHPQGWQKHHPYISATPGPNDKHVNGREKD